MVALLTASEFFAKPFLGFLDKPLDGPALFDRLVELAAAVFGVAHTGFNIKLLFAGEPDQMPLELVQGPHSACDGPGGVVRGTFEDALLVGL